MREATTKAAIAKVLREHSIEDKRLLEAILEAYRKVNPRRRQFSKEEQLAKIATLPKETIKALTFRRFNVPELQPTLGLLFGKQSAKNFGMYTRELSILLAVDILCRLKGRAYRTMLEKVVPVGFKNLRVPLNFLERNGYVQRSKYRPLHFKLTRKGEEVFIKFKKLYVEELLRLKELGINFEDYHG